MMYFVFDHQAQPLPRSDGGVVGCFAFLLKIFIGESSENFHRFRVQAFDKRHHIVVTVRQLFSVRRVTSRTPLHVFRPHISFRNRQMPQQIAQSKLGRCVGPLDLVRRNTTPHAHSALPHLAKIMKEWADRPYLHDPPLKPNSSDNHSVSSSCAFHSSHSLSDTNVSTSISISTQQPNGICDTPKALRAWAPRSPKTSMNNSEASLATMWASVKCGPLLTKTNSFTIRRTSFDEAVVDPRSLANWRICERLSNRLGTRCTRNQCGPI